MDWNCLESVDSYILHEQSAHLLLKLISGKKLFLPLCIRLRNFLPFFDVQPIFHLFSKKTMRVVIPYNVRNEGEYIRFDDHFHPTCVREHSYCYDSFNNKYHTFKFTRQKECETCPLREDSLCQKLFEIKCETAIQKYMYLARGSELWKKLYK